MKKTQKNRWKLPLLFGGIILSLVIILAVIAISLNNIQNKQGQQQLFGELQTKVVHDGHQSCHLSGGIIIDFGDRGMLSYRNQSFVKNANITAGHYKVTLESYDGYSTRAQTDPAGQRHEQYRVKFRKGNEVVATSGVTTDLKDSVTRDRKITVVNNDLKVAKNVDNLYVEHAFQHAAGANSLRAICMKLESIPQPVNGQCGSASLVRMLYDSAPTKNLCAKGTPTKVRLLGDLTDKEKQDIDRTMQGLIKNKRSSGIRKKSGNKTQEQLQQLRDVTERVVNQAKGKYITNKSNATRTWIWQCKSSNGGDNDICTAHGKALPICGDGDVNQSDEECDKGTNENGKVCAPTYGDDCTYCDANCKEKTVTAPKCGDGQIEPAHEECDDGADVNGIVPTVAYGETKEYCKSDCTKGSVTGGQCGNGTIEGDEQCDDGNTTSGDGCDANCQSEIAGSCQIDISPNDIVIGEKAKVSFTTKDTTSETWSCYGAGINDDKKANQPMEKNKTVDLKPIKTGTVVCEAEVTGTDNKKNTCQDSLIVRSKDEPAPEPKDDDKQEDCNSSIGNYIWYDTNGNGVQEDIEEGISGIKVCAYKGDKKHCDTTDKHGRYKIKNLCAGKYTVKVKDVDKMIQTYDPDSKKDNKTKVKLKDNDKHTKADFGYRGKAPSTGFATNVALLIGISTLITIGILLFMRKRGQI